MLGEGEPPVEVEALGLLWPGTLLGPGRSTRLPWCSLHSLTMCRAPSRHSIEICIFTPSNSSGSQALGPVLPMGKQTREDAVICPRYTRPQACVCSSSPHADSFESSPAPQKAASCLSVRNPGQGEGGERAGWERGLGKKRSP